MCPAELGRSPGARPAVPDEAVITANEAGAGWLADALTFGERVLALFMDAAAACASEAGR